MRATRSTRLSSSASTRPIRSPSPAPPRGQLPTKLFRSLYSHSSHSKIISLSDSFTSGVRRIIRARRSRRAVPRTAQARPVEVKEGILGQQVEDEEQLYGMVYGFNDGCALLEFLEQERELFDRVTIGV